MNFWLYIAWRMVKLAAFVFTAPLWFPLIMIAFIIGALVEGLADIYTIWQRDYGKRSK